jgi:hypothetical protein
MKQLNLHGVEVCIATPPKLEKAGANPTEWHRLDASGALLLQPLQWRGALIAAGYDLSRVGRWNKPCCPIESPVLFLFKLVSVNANSFQFV